MKAFTVSVCRIRRRCGRARVRSPRFAIEIGVSLIARDNPLRHDLLHALVPLPIAHFGMTGLDGGAALAELRLEILQFGRYLVFAVVAGRALIQLFGDLNNALSVVSMILSEK